MSQYPLVPVTATVTPDWVRKAGSAINFLLRQRSGTSANSAKSADYTATTDDFFLGVDATDADVAITLPPVTGSGRMLAIKKVDSSAHTVTITAAGSDTIDGAATLVLSSQYDGATLINAAEWSVL